MNKMKLQFKELQVHLSTVITTYELGVQILALVPITRVQFGRHRWHCRQQKIIPMIQCLHWNCIHAAQTKWTKLIKNNLVPHRQLFLLRVVHYGMSLQAFLYVQNKTIRSAKFKKKKNHKKPMHYIYLHGKGFTTASTGTDECPFALMEG